MTPKHHSRFLPRSTRRCPATAPPKAPRFVEVDAADAAAPACPTVTWPRCLNDRSSVYSLTVGERVRPGSWPSPFGWWMSQLPTDAPPTRSLTTRSPTGGRVVLLRHAGRGEESAQRVGARHRLRGQPRGVRSSLAGMAADLIYASGDAVAPADAGGATIGRIQDIVAVPGRPAHRPALVGFVAESHAAGSSSTPTGSRAWRATARGCGAGTSTSTRSTRSRARC